jgi:hypothetical protein
MNKRSLRGARLALLFLTSVLSVGMLATDNSSSSIPPVAKKVLKVTEINGFKLTDNYFWLRGKKNPEVKVRSGEERCHCTRVGRH